MPSLELELAAGGRVAGVDEAGRGPLAGPVVAAAVVLGPGVPRELADMLDDFKKLTAEQRLAAFLALRASAAEIGIGAASVAEILRLNILHASMLAMRRAVGRLAVAPDLALVDGNYPPKLSLRGALRGGRRRAVPVDRRGLDRRESRARPRDDRGWRRDSRVTDGRRTPAMPPPCTERRSCRLGATRHHREAFGTVAQLRLELTIAD